MQNVVKEEYFGNVQERFHDLRNICFQIFLALKNVQDPHLQ